MSEQSRATVQNSQVIDTPYPWYNHVHAATLRLVRCSGVSPSAAELPVAREILAMLTEDELEDAYTASGLDPIPGDRFGRANVYAFLRGANTATVVLLGHFDTVGTEDYGTLEDIALDPDQLAAHADDLIGLPMHTEQSDASPQPAIPAAEWMFGRGTADMKSGVAVNIAIMRRLAARAKLQPLPLSVLFIATPDEENASAGVLHATHLLADLRDKHGLDYLGAINTDYTTATYPGDTHRYAYLGTVGKLLPSFLILGKEAHVGEPFHGVDANLLAAEIIREIALNVDLCDHTTDQLTPPPVTLHAADLKAAYDVQLPFATHVYFNLLTFTSGPDVVLEKLRQHTKRAIDRTLAGVDAAESAWRQRLNGTHSADYGENAADAAPRWAGKGQVYTYAELHALVAARMGHHAVNAELTALALALPVELDVRERSMRVCKRLWNMSGLQGPAVVISYAPPYYPHVRAQPCALHDALAVVTADHSEIDLVTVEVYPYISDMSYLYLDRSHDLSALSANMPLWRDHLGSMADVHTTGTTPATDAPSSTPSDTAPSHDAFYSLPLETIASLNLPVVNLGPYGFGAHQRGERVHIPYSFGVLPQLIYEMIGHLEHLQHRASAANTV